MTTTPTSGAAIQRYKIGYPAEEWSQRSRTPSGIPDASGSWVRYADHVNALAAGQATAAQQGAADGFFFLLLPQRPKPEAPAGTVGLDWDAYSGAQMLAFGRDSSDAAIAALRTEQPAPATQQAGEAWQARASHGQAPAQAQPDQPIACSYGDNGYACCEGGPCQADVHNDKLAEQQAPATAQAADSVPAPPPPPECETEAEKRAFAFGWFKALESERMQADSVQDDAAREAIEKVLALFPFNVPSQKFTVNNGPCLTADNDDEFYSVNRVLAILTEIKTTLDAARKQGGV